MRMFNLLATSNKVRFTTNIVIWDAGGREIMRWKDNKLDEPLQISIMDLAPGLYRIGIEQTGDVLKMKNLIKE